jgi:hypothetical protein
MIWLKRATVATTLSLVCAVVAVADEWNDRTTLKFDAPIMVPGKTLSPGTYTFELLDSKTNRHVVQIFNEDGTKLITTTNAVPTKRMDPKGDVVLRLNPTESGPPAAIKAWFYPGSLYGHEFVYPEKQAREIAQRTKTLVLSADTEASDMEEGTFYTYDAEGRRQPWRADDTLMAEWQKWNEEGKRRGSAQVKAPGTPETRESTAPAMRTEPAGLAVSIADLESDPNRYIGKAINVTGEVEEVFGPRLFKIDEQNWADLDGEVLVYLPTALAALVGEDDRVTVTGTMKTLMKDDLERELGWLAPDPELEIEFNERPVLVASQVVGGDSNVVVAITSRPAAARTQTTDATSGTAPGAATASAVTDRGTIARADERLVGRRVDLDNVKVDRVGAHHGFWIEAAGTGVFVLPAPHATGEGTPAVGKAVGIEGVVLELPRSLRERARTQDGNDAIYIYATSLS